MASLLSSAAIILSLAADCGRDREGASKPTGLRAVLRSLGDIRALADPSIRHVLDFQQAKLCRKQLDATGMELKEVRR